jgi:hypothetical protein
MQLIPVIYLIYWGYRNNKFYEFYIWLHWYFSAKKDNTNINIL